tara:strand:+ start:326 stop:781 length:456 start_codon:yes stop_codon:yes gene_type:complete
MSIKFYDVKPKNLRSEWENILPLLTKVNALQHYMNEDDLFEMAYTEKLDCKFWLAKDDDKTIGMVNSFVIEMPRGNVMVCENPTGIRSREWFDLGLTNLKLYAKIKRCKKIIGPINETLLPLWNMSKKYSRVGFQKDHGWKKSFEVFELEL